MRPSTSGCERQAQVVPNEFLVLSMLTSTKSTSARWCPDCFDTRCASARPQTSCPVVVPQAAPAALAIQNARTTRQGHVQPSCERAKADSFLPICNVNVGEPGGSGGAAAAAYNRSVQQGGAYTLGKWRRPPARLGPLGPPGQENKTQSVFLAPHVCYDTPRGSQEQSPRAATERL